MNDLTPSDDTFDELDELVSSYIDGEATPEEVARVNANPELLARVATFENTREWLASPVTPLPDAEVEQLISGALDVSDTSKRVTDLAAAKGSRKVSFTRLGDLIRSSSGVRLATVAAACVLLAGVAGVLFALNNSDSGEFMATETSAEGDTTSAESTESAESADSEATADAAEADFSNQRDPQADLDLADGTTAALDYQVIDLNIAESYQDLDALINHVSSHWQEITESDDSVSSGDTSGEEGLAEHGLEPQGLEVQGLTERALADVECGASLREYINDQVSASGSGSDELSRGGNISVGETLVSGAPLTVVVVDFGSSTELLTASEPACVVERVATLTP